MMQNQSTAQCGPGKNKRQEIISLIVHKKATTLVFIHLWAVMNTPQKQIRVNKQKLNKEKNQPEQKILHIQLEKSHKGGCQPSIE